MAELQAFIFDLDGVITDTAEYHFLAWKQLGEELGIKIDREFNERLKGVSRLESLNRILALNNRETNFSLEEKEFLATKKNEHYKELIQQVTPNDLLPGIHSLLANIKSNHYKIGLASASKNAPAVIEKLQIGNFFDTIVDAATVKRSKPDPEVFLKAAEQMNVTAEACIGIEDAEAGIESIKAAGMFAVAVGTNEALRKKADMTVERTNQLKLNELIKSFQMYNDRLAKLK
ncbi:beta-phosphoglucomutase [Caldibacillus lycopersici]|uniref:Beta-phosphoglucomutase n=1 Tax=Perspicuibacillus lycopersici TaxID=1325689 RepID=A0AAE3LMV0_9BACI|nr:beta-phosphoglucomutase [Perspicuibacillus lycopersici]MCU9613167.1 beta-phosphoglucomutase [Perspicuibacillus lycopersici]